MSMRTLLLVTVSFSFISAITSSCPPQQGIYLMHRDYCLPDNAEISGYVLTNATPLLCKFSGNGAQNELRWTDSEGNHVNISGSIPFGCFQQSSSNISLYKTSTTDLTNTHYNYTCSTLEHNITVVITATRIVQAIYITPPSDITAWPQNYTVHCVANCNASVKIGNKSSELAPSTTGNLCIARILVEWRPIVALHKSEVKSSSGDQYWLCTGQYENVTEELQTYIQAPSKSPQNLTATNNDTTINITWTPVDNVDGYAVYIYSLPHNACEPKVKLVTSSNTNTQYTADVQLDDYGYIVHIRPYLNLLGQAIQETVNIEVHELNWTLLSDRDNLDVMYYVNWDVEFLQPPAQWRADGQYIENGTIYVTTYQVVNESTDPLFYRHILTVSGVNTQKLSVNYTAVYNTCAWIIESNTIELLVPSGPPMSITANITQSSKIHVSWTPPVGGAVGYVIMYRKHSAKNYTTQMVEATSFVLSNLSEGVLYDIGVFAFKDLPSQLSDTLYIRLAVPDPVDEIQIFPINTTSYFISWFQTSMPVSHFTITLSSSTCSGHHIVLSTMTNSTVLELFSGQVYNIVVNAANALGVSQNISKEYTTLNMAPTGIPLDVNATAENSSTVLVMWKEVICNLRNGMIISYSVMYSVVGVESQFTVSAVNRRILITGLEADSNYSIMVAAVNSNGTGPYSVEIFATTPKPRFPQSAVLLILSVSIPVVVGIVASAVVIVILIIIFSPKKEKDNKSLPCEDDYHECASELRVLNRVSYYDDTNEKDTNTTTTSLSLSDTPFHHNISTIHRVQLEDLSDYVADCHANNNTKFSTQFENLYTGSDKQVTVGFSEANRNLNRFVNITTYNDNRVVLKPIGSHKHDFVNASYVDGYYVPRKFIASQGPMKNTVVDFWRLIWQAKSRCIIMVTNLIDAGKTKCEQYWPNTSQEQMEKPPFTVVLISEKVLPDFIIRTLNLFLTDRPGDVLKLTHYQFTSWPDHGVPEYGTPLMMLHKRVMSTWKENDPPLVVHCSAGVGRTGTFIAIDLAVDQAKAEKAVDITGIVNKLREQRMMMVQSERQYIFIHDAILEKITCGETEIPSDKFTTELKRLKQPDNNNLENQFELLSKVTRSPNEGWFTTALSFPEKNRTKDYLPNENWRVPLKHSSRYIHASFVNGYREKKTFIIAQTTMKNTVEDFLRMLVDYKVPAIVMLCTLDEDKTMCQYWPHDESEEEFGEFNVSILGKSIGDGLVRRNINIQLKGQNPLSVVQFQVKTWPASGIAENINLVISVMESVQAVCRKAGGRETKPVVVHCSDTVGRSGLYCVINNVLEQCKAEGVVDVFQAVKGVRMQKPGAVTTQEQYNFIFEVIEAFLGNYANYANFGLSL